MIGTGGMQVAQAQTVRGDGQTSGDGA